MGLRLRKSVSILPGIRLNLSFSGASLTVGPRGASVNIGPSGTYLNAGLPGTGLYVRERLFTPQRRIHGNLAALSGLAEAAGGTTQQKLDDAVNRYNGLLEHLAHVHWGTPRPTQLPQYDAEEFATPRPIEPVIAEPSLIERFIRSKGAAKALRDAEARKAYEASLAAWEVSRGQHETTELQKKQAFEAALLSEPAKALEAFSEESQSEHWSFPFTANASAADDCRWVYLKVDLPEIEDFPTNSADISRGKLKWVAITPKKRRQRYVQYIHGLVFKLIGHAFACLPRAQELTLVAYTQRPLLSPGSKYDAYILSVRIKREDWARVPFDQLEAVDPVDELERFDLRRDLDRQANLNAITPHPRPDQAPTT